MNDRGVDVSVVQVNGVEVVSGVVEVIVGDMAKVVEDGVSVSVGEVLHEEVGEIESVGIWAWIVAEVMLMECGLVCSEVLGR